MASQSTIDRINDAIAALGREKDALLRGFTRTPTDLADGERDARIICQALNEICLAYGADDADFIRALDEAGFSFASDRAEERMRERRRPAVFADEDYDR